MMIHKRERNIIWKLLFLLPVLSLLVFSVPLSAQTASRIETMLEKPVLNWEDAAVFVLEASDQYIGHFDPQQAFNFAKEHNFLPKNAKMGEAARLDGVALLFMRAFNLKGGIFYSLAKNPHFAYRELVYQEVIQGRTDPGMTVCGEDFLFMLGRVLTITEDTLTDTVGTAGTPEKRKEVIDTEKVAAQEALVAEINIQFAEVEDVSAEVTAEGVTIRLSNIQFLANSAVLSESERAKLREIAVILKTIPGKRILVSGHTAMAGTRADRQRTSLERAQSAASYLVTLGARRINEITVQGYGADRPIADSNTPQGMALNRRVEITILDD